MKAIDTNVLARYFVDDPEDPQAAVQRPAALNMMRQRVFVSDTVLLELEWVLRGFYEFPRGQILRVFLLQGGVLGLGGALAGSGLGALALALWQRFARGADGQPLFLLSFEPSLFAAALALATLTGLIAAFAPALRAARLDPVVAIRG